MGTPLGGYDADVWMAANPSVVVVSEATTNIDAGALILYKAATHWAWDKRVPVVIQCSPNGTSGWVTVTDYTFQYAGGVIVFNTPRVAAANNFVKILSGYYFNLTQLDLSHTWSLALKAATNDTTVFQTPGQWATAKGGLLSGTGKVDTIRSDGRIFLELGALVAMQFYVDKTGGNVRWEVLAYVTALDPKNEAKGLNTQSLTVDIEGDCYLRVV